jgi:hypothetical protein
MPTEDLSLPVYLGDGLYAEYDGWQIRIYASNGVRVTNEVYLEPSVLQSFLSYIKTIRERS